MQTPSTTGSQWSAASIPDHYTVLIGTMDALEAVAHAMLEGMSPQGLAELYGQLLSTEPLTLGMRLKSALTNATLEIKVERTDKSMDAVEGLAEK